MTLPTATAPASLAARLFGGWVRRLDAATLRTDGLAGLLGAVLVLPQAIAFATLAGLPPEIGLATAILPCIVAALFGSSWQVMSGPTNTMSLALFAMLAPLALPGSPSYLELAFAVTLMVGLLQGLIGALRLGAVASFISPAALLGFTGGAALLIAVHALKDGLGLPAGHQGAGAIVAGLLREPGQIAAGALAVALLTAGVALGLKRLAPRSPALLVGVAAGTALAWLINRGDTLAPVRTLGAIPLPWPTPHWPQVAPAALPELLGLAFALTLVALAQQIAIAKAVAARTGQRLDTDREFVGQGLANLVGGLSSSYVACGSINRSMPNLEAGARTPLAAVFSALWLALLVVVAAPLLAWIPLAAIAGLLWVVAAGLLELPRWRALRRIAPGEFAVALATLVATVTLRLEVAILLGSLLSLGAYLHRTAKPAMRSMGFDAMTPGRPFVVLEGQPAALPECPQLKLLRMEGAVYFGAAAHVSDTLHALRDAPDAPRHLLVMSKSMNFIDPAGVQVWSEELAERRALGGDLYFHRPRPPVLETWQRAGFLDALGPGHVFPDKHHAIAAIVPRLDEAVCARCTARVFHECAQRPGAALAPEI
jgi:SulP family sulfate permease